VTGRVQEVLDVAMLEVTARDASVVHETHAGAEVQPAPSHEALRGPARRVPNVDDGPSAERPIVPGSTSYCISSK
jgi:hypothetical protein